MSTRTLDLGDNRPFSGIIGRPRHLAWPVHAYRITIPATLNTGRHYLNPFERVVLNVIDAVGGQDEDALAEQTCIPSDLVRNVILRLRDNGLINDDNLIIDRQRRSWEPDTRKDIYTSALAFRELGGGRLLPFVLLLDDNNSIKTKAVDPGTRTMPQDHESRRPGPPSARDIIAAITQMKRRSEAHAQFTRMPTIEQIRVEPEPEYYLLDCPIAIQARDADFRIADPFGTGFSRVLEDVLSRRLETDEKLQEWMTKWRQNLSTPTPKDAQQPRPREPFVTDQNRRRYPNLVRTLTPAPGAPHRSVEDIYASLEWALFYCCELNDPGVAIRRLKQETGSSYSQWLSGVAEGIGFEIPGTGFHPVANGKLDDYHMKKPERETVLAIALLQAEDDYEHPLRTMAKNDPDFIVRIRTLGIDRGDRAHGKHVTLADEAPLESDPWMRETISTLLPDIRFGSQDGPADAASQADLRLEARTSLLQEIGYRTFNMLGPSAQASLLAAEQFWLVCRDGDDARAFLSNLYSALQGTLRGFSSGAAPIGVGESDYKRLAGAIADEAGLGPLPEALRNVNPRRIREALQGNDLSIGASAIALLLTASQATLREVASAQPDFLAVIADIHARRGHSNQPESMPKEDAGKLRRSAITTLVTVLELTLKD